MKKDIEEQIKKVEQIFDNVLSELNYLEVLLEEGQYKYSLIDVSDIKDYLQYCSQYLNYLEEDFADESKLHESTKKRKKNYHLNTNAGNVEYNVAMFNHMNNSDKGSNFFPGVASSVGSGNADGGSAGMGEAMETNTKSNKDNKDVYMYEGPVTRFGKPFVANDKTYAHAVSPKDALNRISYVIKKKYGLDPKTAKIELNPDYIKLVRSKDGQKIDTTKEDTKSAKDKEIEAYREWLNNNMDLLVSTYTRENMMDSLSDFAYKLYLKTR